MCSSLYLQLPNYKYVNITERKELVELVCKPLMKNGVTIKPLNYAMLQSDGMKTF